MKIIEIVATIVEKRLYMSSVVIIIAVLSVVSRLTIMCTFNKTKILKTVAIRQNNRVEIDATDSGKHCY